MVVHRTAEMDDGAEMETFGMTTTIAPLERDDRDDAVHVLTEAFL